MDEARFKQLYELTQEGDMEAQADLWIEFEFAYGHDPLPKFMQPPALEGEAPSDPTTTRNAEGGAQC
jgi:hypothetical protein